MHAPSWTVSEGATDNNKQKIGNEKAEMCRYLRKEYQLARTLLKNGDIFLAPGIVTRKVKSDE
jgi:hypothetical protein